MKVQETVFPWNDLRKIFDGSQWMAQSVRLSVTFVHPTQAIEIFGNVSTPFGTLAIY